MVIIIIIIVVVVLIGRGNTISTKHRTRGRIIFFPYSGGGCGSTMGRRRNWGANERLIKIQNNIGEFMLFRS